MDLMKRPNPDAVGLLDIAYDDALLMKKYYYITNIYEIL